MNPLRLTRTEATILLVTGAIFVSAGAWTLWQIHAGLAVGMGIVLVATLRIYHRKVCTGCPQTDCPANPLFWKKNP